MEKISVNEFWKKLKQDVEDIAKQYKWNFDSELERNYAFQLWISQLLYKVEEGFDREPEDSLLYLKSLGADIVLEDPTRKYLVIARCEYESRSKKKTEISNEKLKEFFNKHYQFLNKNKIRALGSEIVFQALGDYKERVEDGYTISYYYFSPSEATGKSYELANEFNEKFANQSLQLKCSVYGFTEIKELYVQSKSLEESTPDVVRFKLPEEQFFEVKSGCYSTIVVVIRGNTLRGLYKQHRESLFAWNIRGYLGSNSINSEILRTAKDSATNFFYFNNGVSAICTNYEVIDGEIIANNFQIINGAQTVGTLGRARENTDIQVLFRLTQTTSVKTDKGINSDIIRYNNTQNSIKVSDFRANDPIQTWLERQFSQFKPRGPLPVVRYLPKRTKVTESKSTVKIKFEELAKIRYAFLWEPTLIHSSTKELWTPRTEGGAYEKAFGIPSEKSEVWEIAEVWTEEHFQNCLIAIAFFIQIDKITKQEGNLQKKNSYLKRLNYHTLAFAGIYIRAHKEEKLIKELLGSEEKFFDLWENFWNNARFVLIDAYDRAIDEDKSTIYSLVRSVERWKQMKRRFVRYAGIADPDED